MKGPKAEGIHFTQEHWLLCHMGLNLFEFEFGT